MNAQVMICFATGQPDCNLVPILSSSFHSKKVCLLTTPEMQKKASIFQKALKDYIEVEIIELGSSDDIGVIQDVLMETIDKYENRVVNISGGKKPMAIAAFNVCSAFSVPVLYLDIDTFNVFLFENFQSNSLTNHRRVNIKSEVKNNEKNLKLYLKTREIFSTNLREWKGPSATEKEYFDFIMKSRTEQDRKTILEGLRILNKYAVESVNSKYPKTSITDSHLTSFSFNIIREELEKLEFLIPGDDKSLRFKDKQTADFLAGKWFEKYCAMEIKNIFPQIPIFHGEVIQGDIKNELDLIFLKGGKLFFGEVKTSNLSQDKPQHSNIAYKLNTLMEKVGGKSAKACLMSLGSLGSLEENQTKKRFDNYKIKKRFDNYEICCIDNVLGRADLLRKKLREWITYA